ncbi:MAG TPA: PIN domain-containing protein [Acetobacteraceae bacterium]|nr:PIN domain-containing protein [Acetobacteraceae bacterium]
MSGTVPLIAFLDVSALDPALLHNVLMHLALADLFRARWSGRVHEEWIAALLKARPDLTRECLARVRSLMEAHVGDALVAGYEHLIEQLALPDRDDRHVLAAAIHGGATVIVTANLRDFPPRHSGRPRHHRTTSRRISGRSVREQSRGRAQRTTDAPP